MTTKPNCSELEKFFNDKKNSHVRESILNSRLLYDLKLAAANCSYFLSAYYPEVDKDGFDIIFDHSGSFSNVQTKIQLKTVMHDAKTSRWKIHKDLIRPTPYRCEQYGFTSTPYDIGYEGGIILMELDAVNNDLNVRYFYTDILFLCAFDQELIRVKRPPSRAVLDRVIGEIQDGPGSEKVEIPKSMFLEARNPDCLMALMGMPSNISHSGSLRGYIMQFMHQYTQLKPHIEPHKIRYIDEELSKLSSRGIDPSD